MGLLLKERLCSQWEQSLSFKGRPIPEATDTRSHKSSFICKNMADNPPIVSSPLKNTLFGFNIF